jgi:hypothetical protein
MPATHGGSSADLVLGAALGTPPPWLPGAVSGGTLSDPASGARTAGAIPSTGVLHGGTAIDGPVALMYGRTFTGWIRTDGTPREYPPRSAGLVTASVRLPAVAWNNSPVQVELNALAVSNAPDTGIATDGLQQSDTLDPFRFVEFDVVVTADSPSLPATIASDVDFAWDTPSVGFFRITGLRGLILSHFARPAGYAERYRWVTDITTCDDDREYREALLARQEDPEEDETLWLPAAPVRSIDWAGDAITVAEMQRMLASVRFGLERPVVIPRWLHATSLDDDLAAPTTFIPVVQVENRDFVVGEQLAIMSEDDPSVVVVRTIEAIAPGSPDIITVDVAVEGFAEGDYVIPCIPCVPDAGGLTRWMYGDRGSGTIRFTEF